MNSTIKRTRSTIYLVLTFVALIVAFTVGQARAKQFTCSLEPHQVQSGDTLWRIAENNCEGNIQAVTDNLVAVYGDPIQVGNTIYLPENQDCLLTMINGHIYEECK